MARSADADGSWLPRATDATGPGPGFHLGYRRWLDGLRGLAIVAVLAYHLKLLPSGFLGVDLFFVLSGFLITTLLIEEWQRHSSISLKRFYLRRALRLWPALFTLLITCGLVAVLFRPPDVAWAVGKEILVSACYVTNWLTLHGVSTPTLGHTWSLSVEEQFYLIWPVLLYGMLRSGLGRRWIILCVCMGIAGSASLRAVLYWRHPTALLHIYRLYMGLDTRADSLLAGCLVGLLVGWGLLPRSRRFLVSIRLAALASTVVLGYLLVVPRHFGQRQLHCGLYTLVALMVAVILVRLLSLPSPLAIRVLESRPLVGVGRISYALYLYHTPIIGWLQPAGLGRGHARETLVVLGLSVTAAVVSWYGIEQPCLRLKERLSAGGVRSGRSARGVGWQCRRPELAA